MSVTITNNKVIISRDDPIFGLFESHLVKFEDDRLIRLYEYNSDKDLEFGSGLYFLLQEALAAGQKKIQTELKYHVSSNYGDYRNLLNGLVLREDQIVAVIKSLQHRRGILQMATGSGKSLCIAGILKYLSNALGYLPPTLLLEPTNYLVNEMSQRMASYGIANTCYSASRNTIAENILYISHPSSICNDLENNPNLLNGIKILIADEAHHEHSATWSRIYNNCNSIEISLGFSAYLVDASKINNLRYNILSYNEAKAISCTGPVLLNLDTAYYINLGVLANPVLLRMFNPADEVVWDDKDWQELRKTRLESEKRRELICKTALVFSEKGYKTLVLSNTKAFATDILMQLYDMGVRTAVCSFGAGEYVSIVDHELRYSKDPIFKEKFATGEITVMICTSHMFEGADIPNLDAVILAEVGKKVRKVIQGVGRGLRKTKKGKYAYIIDFTDHKGGVLAYHSNLRMDYYKTLIGVRQVADNVQAENLEKLIDQLES